MLLQKLQKKASLVCPECFKLGLMQCNRMHKKHMGRCSECHATFDGGSGKNPPTQAREKFKRHLKPRGKKTGRKGMPKCTGHPPSKAGKRKAPSLPSDTGTAEADNKEKHYQAFKSDYNNIPTSYADSSTPAQRVKIRAGIRLQAILDFGLYPPQCQRLVDEYNHRNSTQWTLANVDSILKRSSRFFEAVVEFLCTIKIKNNDAVDLTGK